MLTKKEIVPDSDPRIRLTSEPVSLPLNQEDKDLLQALYTYVKQSQDDELAEKYDLVPAVGIAAIQVGVPKQMLAVVAGPNQEYALANPVIVSKSVQMAYLERGEGCLSVPDTHEGHAYRHARIKVKAYDLLTDQEVLISAEGFLSIVLQHEIDHLSGTLYYDHIDPNDPFRIDPEAEVI